MARQNIARLEKRYIERVGRVREKLHSCHPGQTLLLECAENLPVGHNLVLMHRLMEMG